MGKRLENKIAVITGGTSGIGERTAEIFVEQGASVVIAGRSSKKGNEITDRLGDHAVFIRTDVTQEGDPIKGRTPWYISITVPGFPDKKILNVIQSMEDKEYRLEIAEYLEEMAMMIRDRTK